VIDVKSLDLPDHIEAYFKLFSMSSSCVTQKLKFGGSSFDNNSVNDQCQPQISTNHQFSLADRSSRVDNTFSIAEIVKYWW
jgi:hypothetical protein